MKRYEGECYDTWMYECVEWYNNVVYAVERNIKVHKHEQLFIHGPINVGKSSLVEKLIWCSNMKYIFILV